MLRVAGMSQQPRTYMRGEEVMLRLP